MTGFSAPETPSEEPPSTEPRQEIPTAPDLSTSAYISPYPETGHERVQPDSHSTGTSSTGRKPSSLKYLNSHMNTRSSLGILPPRLDQTPAEAYQVLEALTGEDMERLRMRRMRGRDAGGDVDGRYGNNGLPRSTDLGLGMVAKEVKDDVLPLRSGYFDWAMDYFRTPQMKVKGCFLGKSSH